MSINVGQVSHDLSDGKRFYAYSGIIQGDVSVPATITLINIDNTGLKDSYICLDPCYGLPVGLGANDALGIIVRIDDVEVYRSQTTYSYRPTQQYEVKFFVPRQSKFEVISLNTANNNTQDRGCTMLGWYL